MKLFREIFGFLAALIITIMAWIVVPYICLGFAVGIFFIGIHEAIKFTRK